MTRNKNTRALIQRVAGTTLQSIAAAALTLVSVFPLYWMLVSSFKSQEEILLSVPTLWPREFHFENYINVFNRAHFSTYYLNTLILTVGILVVQVITGILAAYGFSKGRFKGQNILFIVVLGAMMIPLQVTFIPIYIMFAKWKLIDTYLGLILPEAVSPYFIFMVRQSFMSVHDSYVDAAKVDGMGTLGIITRIMVPMCKATIATIVLITLTAGWNSYFWPKIITKSESRRVLTIGLAHLRNTFAGMETMNNHEIMAGAVMAIVPIVILFFVFQKYMLTGYSKAAMK
ncbi:MAG: carbohydrate ABC transporter permease [Treponema sp.]|jgi:ABC-type glycerol-3-phosphate transport system permease component|nr:carbohydrate ABC transporter permease [Treponema sp.]